MAWELKYGDGQALQLELANTTVVADCANPRGVPVEDATAVVAAAVRQPLEFPPLAEALVPGDHLAIALAQGVPCAAQVIEGLVQGLDDRGRLLGRLSVVLAEEAEPGTAGQLEQLREQISSRFEISVHDPTDASNLCYLAASAEGKPLYFNRVLCEADVVVPITPVRLSAALGYSGVHGGLFPAFSDEPTRERFRAPSSLTHAVQQRRRHAEVDEAAWLLGVQFIIQILPGAGDSILSLAAGASAAVSAAGRVQGEAAWLYQIPRRAPLVVATIRGGPQQQTWENFARALFSASRAVSEDGAVLLCTGLSAPPGPALERLAAASDDQQVLHDLRRDRSCDAISASLLIEAKQRVRVFLLSDLDQEFVEDLGVGHIRTGDEVERLSRQFPSCILLGDAQHAAVQLGDPE